MRKSIKWLLKSLYQIQNAKLHLCLSSNQEFLPCLVEIPLSPCAFLPWASANALWSKTDNRSSLRIGTKNIYGQFAFWEGYPKQNSVIRLKSNIFAPPKKIGLATPLVWCSDELAIHSFALLCLLRCKRNALQLVFIA